jgi:large subunit ribosomal protein L2
MLKVLRPTTSTRRHTIVVKPTNVKGTKENIPNNLLVSVQYKAGRTNGRVTTRHKGGRVKRTYRIIDFKRDKYDIKGEVESIHYDPFRTANIALIKYIDGDRRFILATKNMKIGDEVISGKEATIYEGNAMPLTRIPDGSFIHNVELKRGSGGILGRSAGVSIQKQGNVKEYVQLKMPSGEIRLVLGENFATLGEIGNEDHSKEKIGKAGTNRKKGIRPTVRGVAMSIKHPHAGGQGKSGRGGPGGPARTPWGKKQMAKTRKNKSTNKYIIKRRTGKTRPNVKGYRTIY